MTCSKCRADNPQQARYCLQCGSPLQARDAAAAEERKVVSVLFVDLVGFTQRSHAADPEDVRATLAPYHALLRREIERFGGTVEKFIGDAVMAVFGAPVTHEDDAERAVRAALRIVDAIEELNRSRPGAELAVRAAVNTGEGLVCLGARPDAGETMVTGDVVNTASRLQEIAPVNGVVTGEVTYRRTRPVIRYAALNPVTVKGKPDPLTVWQAVSAISRFGVDAAASHTTPLIGRDLELLALRTAFQRSLEQDSVQLVTVVGEPGIGKSRLLEELRLFLDEGPEIVAWRQGRCLPYGEGITFWPLGEVVKAQAGILESDSAEEAAGKLEAAVAAVVDDPSERPWFRARLGVLVGLAPSGGGGAKEESFTAWRRFLEAMAARRPLVLVFEDLHWADPTMLDFVEHLVEWVSDVALTVVCTARPELYGSHPSWGGGIRNATTVSLSALTDAQTAQLVSSLLSQAVLPAGVHATLLERAGGNPLYAEEFVGMLTDRGILRAEGRVLSIDTTADIPVPDSVRALIAARLDTLGPERKTLLQAAAVAGKVFWSGAVAAVAGADEETVRTALHELARKEIVRPVRSSSVEGQQEYSFWHALIRDVAYAQMPRAVRARRHTAMAAWIESVAAERAADHADVLAYHYVEALRLSEAVGDDTRAAELAGLARSALVAAGDRAAGLDVAKAHACYTQALSLLPTGHPDRPRVLVKAGLAARQQGQLDECERLCEDAMAEAERTGDILARGQAMTNLRSALWHKGQVARARALGQQAVSLLEAAPPGVELADARLCAAEDATLSGDLATALEQAQIGLALAHDLGADDQAVTALIIRGATRCLLGDLDGMEDLRAAHEQALHLGLGITAAYAHGWLSEWTWLAVGSLPARRLYDQLVEFAEARGMADWALSASSEVLRVRFDLGDWDELLAACDDVMQRCAAGNAVQYEVFALLTKGQVLVFRGELALATTVHDRVVPLARDLGDLQVLVPALAMSSILAFRQGEDARATSAAAELAELTRGNRWRAHHLPAMVRHLVAAGHTAMAQDLMIGVEFSAARDRHSALAARAVLAEARGEHHEALAVYADAAQRWAEFGSVLEEGYALLGQGRCLWAMGAPEAAEDHTVRAGELLGGLGVPVVTDGRDPGAQPAQRPA